MELAAEKVREAGSEDVLLTDRGTFFGYERLVNDMTALATMRQYAPVIFDATHSVQHPGGGRYRRGPRAYPPSDPRAMAVGVDGLFLETHDNPAQAKSDAATVWPLNELENLLRMALRVRAAATDA